MFTQSKLLLFFLAACSVCSASSTTGTLCSNGASLVSYLSLSGTGCTNGPLTYTSFEFEAFSGPLTASDFSVRTNAGGGIGFYSSGLRRDLGSTSELYSIRYFYDPPPIIIGEDLSLDFGFSALAAAPLDFAIQASTPGTFAVTEFLCPGMRFFPVFGGLNPSANVCGTNPTTSARVLQVTLENPVAPISFPATDSVGVRLYFQLSGDLSSSNVIGINSTPRIDLTQIPEPLPTSLIGGGLMLLVVFRQRVRRRNGT